MLSLVIFQVDALWVDYSNWSVFNYFKSIDILSENRMEEQQVVYR